MKTCPACHLVYEDRFIFCTRDGTILDSDKKVNGSSTRKAAANGNNAAENSLQSHRVMRCPVCAMEYPLTFTSCPNDGMRLIEKKTQPSVVAAQAAQPDSTDIVTEELSSPIASPAEPVREPITQNEDQASQPENQFAGNPIAPGPVPYISIEPEVEPQTYNHIEDYYSEPRYVTAPISDESSANDSRSLRIAAKSVVTGLALITVIALYFVYDAGSQKPVIATTTPQEAYSAQPPVFIPTPEEARNYEDEAVEPPSDQQEPNRDDDDQRVAGRLNPSSEDSTARRRLTAVEPPERETRPVTKSEVRAPSEVDTGPVIPQSTEGRISSRLLRMRSSRIGAGVRYDLTFALEEQTGRVIRWDRLLVSTRSSRGINQTQTIPFYHRQGADGSLTFTVSVEMKGGSDADWRGRVICTTLGTDERGRSMQARFGASVAP